MTPRIAGPSSRTITLSLWAAVAFLAVVGAAALWSIDSLRDLTRTSAETEKMLNAASALRNRMSDAQSALLVYVAAGDEKEVPRFRQELASARKDLAAFEATLDAAQRKKHGSNLRALFDAQFRMMDGVARLRQQQGFGAALEVARSAAYLSQVDLGDNLVGDLTQSRATVLEEERVKTRILGDAALALVIGGGVVASAILLLADRLARRYRRQRDQSGARVRESERFLRTITDNIPAMVSYLDHEERYRYHNRIMLDWMAVKEDAINGRTLRDVIGEKAYAVTGPFIKRVLAGEVVAWERTQTGARGDKRDLNIVCIPDRDGAGKVTGLYAFLTDISEGKRLAQLKNEFVSTVSHELRTPLTSIRGSLGLIEGGVAGVLPDKAKNLVSVARNNCERLIRLINDILDIEKIESGKVDFDMKPVELMPLVRQSLADNEGYARTHNCSFVITNEEPGALVSGDRDRLLQVIANLLSNAAKYAPPGSNVELSVARKDDRLRLTVTDLGPGIPAEFRERIFQKFSQADSSDTRKKGGSGLGLSIAKAIVEHHGGGIGFDTRTAEDGGSTGTTFWVDLPALRVYEAADESARKLIAELVTRPGPAPRDMRPSVLHVEDDAGLRSVVAMLLEPFARTEGVATLAAAHERIAERHYDLVLLDIALPDGSGWDLFDKMREVSRHPPVIVFSGSNVAQSRLADVEGALLKAHSSDDELVATIRRALGEQLVDEG
jgi:PAS domain S-box-containing protein